MTPKVSIIIPTYKRHHLLNKAVDSALAQSYDNLEIVVIDDNPPESTERNLTINAMKKYETNDSVIYCLNEKSCGGSLARNKGINEASGEYITFLDDDDVYLPKKIETQIEFILQNDLEMSFTDLYLCDPDGRLIEHRSHPYVTDWSKDELMRQHVLHHLCGTPTFMIKKEALNRVGGFEDVVIAQEFLLMWRMIENGTKIGYLPVSHVVAYCHDGEHISVGSNRLEGEKWLYELKKTKLSLLNAQERRYLEFRHCAVLAVSCRRTSKHKEALKYSVKTVITSPRYCAEEALKILKHRLRTDRFEPQPVYNGDSENE